MNYPNKKKSSSEIVTNHGISHSNRGMSLEEDINKTNDLYLIDNIAVIHKKPTPVTIVKVDYAKRSATKITEAYFKQPSTTDYNGIYKGKYIDFEAKECHHKTLFPFALIHDHQIKHLQNVLNHGAIAFIIIRMYVDNKDYYIKAEDFLAYYNSTDKKSLSLEWIRENGKVISNSYKIPCHYLDIIDKEYKL